MKNYLQYLKEAKKSLSNRQLANYLFNNVLFFMAHKNPDEIIARIDDLIKKGLDINTKNVDGWTALLCVVFNLIRNNKTNSQFINITKYLLKLPTIDVTCKYANNMNFIDYLKHHKIDDSFIKDYNLQEIILNNKREDILLFFDKYNLVHPDIKKENSYLFKAADWGLIGVNENLALKQKWFRAIVDGDLTLINRLIEFGIDVNMKSEGTGASAILLSTYNKRKCSDILNILLKQPGIDVNVKDNKGRTILMKLLEYGWVDDIKNLLKNKNIDLNSQDNEGDTPLMIAAYYDHIECVKLLLNDPRIDVNKKIVLKSFLRKPSDLKTALNISLRFKRDDISKEILKTPNIIVDKDDFERMSKNQEFEDYDLQKYLMDNGRSDIVLSFDKYNFVHPDIRKEYPEFKAKDWGLIDL